jgi:Ca2+-transporting ATPase
MGHIEFDSQGSNVRSDMPWAPTVQDVLERLSVAVERGLGAAEVKERRRKYGPNRLQERQRRPAWIILVSQFKSPVVALLGGATVLALSFGQWLEGAAIAVAIGINAAIGFVTELQAVRSMETLRRMGQVQARVRRGKRMQEVPAAALVPGDIVHVEAGDLVSADLRLVAASLIQADESPLTGESVPVDKTTEPLEQHVPLAERNNMLFKGTAVTRGSGVGVVVATGPATELGHISSLAAEAQDEVTPLEQQLSRLAYKLVWVTLIIAVLVAVGGLLSHEKPLLIIETAIALAVAAIPEGLPIVVTVALAYGMWRMTKRNALMNRLSAVETLGATNIICSDKTGTLTENRMSVVSIALPSDRPGEMEEVHVRADSEGGGFFLNGEEVILEQDSRLGRILETAVLCNNAELKKNDVEKGVGDPTELALLEAGEKAGLRRDRLLTRMPEQREEAFDPETAMMATFHEDDEGYRIAVKGSPQAVIDACTTIGGPQGETDFAESDRERWLARNDAMAGDGLRVLAAAAGRAGDADVNPYRELTFLGLLGLVDPARKGVGEAISECRNAGIRVIMVTGDQPATSRHVGQTLGLVDEGKDMVVHGSDLGKPEDLSEERRKELLRAGIFARVTPEQKLDLIALHQEDGSVVAMTGDGVNDAPALKKADIGIAMGRRGTQVAREAADMVLKDDAFATIVAAIEQGRAIFDNIRRFILYLLSGNIGEIMIVSVALAIGAPLPLLPLQILYLNMIGDVFPALALGVGRGDSSEMQRPPRDPSEPVMTKGHWLAVGTYGALIAASVLAAFGLVYVWLSMGSETAVSISFLTLAFSRLWHVFNMRDPDSHMIRNSITRNPFVWGTLTLCSGLLVGAVYVPGLSSILELVPPGGTGWLLILGFSLVPLAVGQIWKAISFS